MFFAGCCVRVLCGYHFFHTPSNKGIESKLEFITQHKISWYIGDTIIFCNGIGANIYWVEVCDTIRIGYILPA